MRIISIVMFRKPARHHNSFPFRGFQGALSVQMMHLLMTISVTLCQSPGVQESKMASLFTTSSVPKYTVSSLPTAYPLQAQDDIESAPKSTKYFYSSLHAGPWIAHRAGKVGASTHIGTATAVLILTSSDSRSITLKPTKPAVRKISTRKDSISTPLLSTTPIDVPGSSTDGLLTRMQIYTSIASTSLVISQTSSPSPNAAVSGASTRAPHQILSGSVSSLQSYLHVITRSEVSATSKTASSKSSRFSSPTGVISSNVQSHPKSATTVTGRPTTKAPTYTCYLEPSGKPCVCYNCRKIQDDQECCTELIPNSTLQQGVLVKVASINVDEFIKRMDQIKNALAEVVFEACRTVEGCGIVYGEPTNRGRRSAKASSSGLNYSKHAQHESNASRETSARVEESPVSVKSSAVKLLYADVVIFDLEATLSGGLQTALYVIMTSQRNVVNVSGVLNGTALFDILKKQASAVERKLNLSIIPISNWKRDTDPSWQISSTIETAVQESTAVYPDTTAPTVEAQAQNTPKKMSETTLILIIAAGSLGFLALLILAFYLGKYFSRKMNGEFVPAKIYQNSEDSSNPELVPSFIDPSGPRITDVPHKPVRAQSSRTQSNATATTGGSPKKPKKPMGVKITYKPPKWD